MIVGGTSTGINPLTGEAYSTGLQISPGSAYAQELRKHEALHTQYGPPGRPYVYREYPTMMYKATQPPQGGPLDLDGQQAGDDYERSRLEAQGFVHGGRVAAAEAFYARQTEIAELAANRVTHEFRMSEQARNEAQAADASTSKHLASIPEQPRRPGRPRKEASDVSA